MDDNKKPEKRPAKEIAKKLAGTKTTRQNDNKPTKNSSAKPNPPVKPSIKPTIKKPKTYKTNNPIPLKAYIILHSLGENNFVITDINFSNTLYNDLLEGYSNLTSSIGQNPKMSAKEKQRKEKIILEKMQLLDTVKGFAAEDLGDYGTVSVEINRNLWKKNRTERFFSLEGNLQYVVRSEYDYDVTYSGIIVKVW